MWSFANIINQKTKIYATLGKHKRDRSLDQWSKHHLPQPTHTAPVLPSHIPLVAITQGNTAVSHMPVYLLAKHCTFTHIFRGASPTLAVIRKAGTPRSVVGSLCVPHTAPRAASRCLRQCKWQRTVCQGVSVKGSRFTGSCLVPP